MGECYAELEKDDVETLLEEETEVVEGEVGRARAQHSPHVALARVASRRHRSLRAAGRDTPRTVGCQRRVEENETRIVSATSHCLPH